MTIRVERKDGEKMKFEGKYKVLDGEKIDYEMSQPSGETKQEVLKIKKLTDDELDTEDPDGIKDEFKRVKEKKKRREEVTTVSIGGPPEACLADASGGAPSQPCTSRSAMSDPLTSLFGALFALSSGRRRPDDKKDEPEVRREAARRQVEVGQDQSRASCRRGWRSC